MRIAAIPLYYSGLSETSIVKSSNGQNFEKKLDGAYQVELNMEVPSNGYSWCIFEEYNDKNISPE